MNEFNVTIIIHSINVFTLFLLADLVVPRNKNIFYSNRNKIEILLND